MATAVLVCRSVCSAGLTPTSLGNGLSESEAALPALFSVPTLLSYCLRHLRRDYATCGIDKAVADARFATCIGAPPASASSDALTSWVFAACTAEGALSNETALAVARQTV